MRRLTAVATGAVLMAACGGAPAPPADPAAVPVPGSFGADLALLRAHTDVVLLKSADGQAQVAVAPGYQGRVMTSTAGGDAGASFGYLHRAGIEAGKPSPHMTVLGGEDRFWLGPEGGQYALYFAPRSPFDTEHWQVPPALDWGGWPVTTTSATEVGVSQPMSVTNHSGTPFTLRVDRTVRLLDRDAVGKAFGQAPPPDLHVVAYESDNRITNTGAQAWTKSSGLISIWILGMYRPAPKTTIVIPVVPGSAAERGPMVNDAYFGAIPADRLKVTDRVVYLRGDGKRRGKIGIPRPRAREVAGSYDPDSHVLTLVQFTLPADARDYVNSMWATQKQPYGGDVVNSYNDGPLSATEPPLGPFYEIESSSPAAALAPGASLRHVHRTVHMQGPEAALDVMAKAVLGVSLADITGSLPVGGQ